MDQIQREFPGRNLLRRKAQGNGHIRIIGVGDIEIDLGWIHRSDIKNMALDFRSRRIECSDFRAIEGKNNSIDLPESDGGWNGFSELDIKVLAAGSSHLFG